MYAPTIITALILIGITTAQFFTDIGGLDKGANVVFFMALVLIMGLVNILLGDRIAWVGLGLGVILWLVILLVKIFGGKTASPGDIIDKRCVRSTSSSAAATKKCKRRQIFITASYPPCPQVQPQPQQQCECGTCDPETMTTDCIDIQCK
jgi:hypothetical protein